MVMRRRDFLKAITAGFLLNGVAPFSFVTAKQILPEDQGLDRFRFDSNIKDYLHKMENFDQPHPGDIYVEKDLIPVLCSSLLRFKRLELTVGHGNFYILSFDRALYFARTYSYIGEFTKEELNFLEKIFYTESSDYGFIGEKPINNITYRINEKDTLKIPETGNYLYRGRSYELYEKIKNIVGDKLYLTSGVRGVVKQFMLFLDKAYNNEGNLSLASRSLAPPGYSFHGIADFDVGQVGYGTLNFTAKFTDTEVFKKLEELDYISIRYPKDNLKGVRFEPWHIRVHQEI